VTKSIGSNLPAGIVDLLDGADLASREGLLLLLMTVADDGLVHVTMLSVGEVVAVAPDHLRLALWPQSTSAEQLDRSGKALLYVVADGAGYAIDIRTRLLGTVREPGLQVTVFDATVADVREDRVAYAELTSAATFRLLDRDRVLERWERTVVAMQRLPGGSES
jgi:hypothetical protein